MTFALCYCVDKGWHNTTLCGFSEAKLPRPYTMQEKTQAGYATQTYETTHTHTHTHTHTALIIHIRWLVFKFVDYCYHDFTKGFVSF